MAYHPWVWGWLVWRLAPPHLYRPLFGTVNVNSLLTFLQILFIILNIEQVFDYATKGAGIMLHSEMVVLCKIRESKDPERALQIATDVILEYLKQRESSPPRSAALPQELCAAT